METKYRYFVVFEGMTLHIPTKYTGNIEVELPHPIINLTRIQEMERIICDLKRLKYCTVLDFKRFEDGE